jgi:hypothetical protein
LVCSCYVLSCLLYIGQIIPSVRSVGRVSSSHIFIISMCILHFSSIPPCFINSAGILSGPAALCVLSFFLLLDLLRNRWVEVLLLHCLRLYFPELVLYIWHSCFVNHKSIVCIFVECLYVLTVCYHF